MKRIALFITSIAVFTSCHKDHGEQVTPKRITVIANEETPAATTKFNYDTNGRLISAENSDVIGSYQFVNNQVKFSGVTKPGNLETSRGTFTLDNQGRAIHFEYIVPGNGGLLDTAHYDYEYNADGYLSKTKSTYSNGQTGEIQMEYVNGNLTKETFLDNGGMTAYWIYTYTTNEDKINLNTNFTYYTNCIAGKKSHNLPLKATEYNAVNIKQAETAYEYQLDGQGFVTKRTVHFTNTGTVVHEDYSYNK